MNCKGWNSSSSVKDMLAGCVNGEYQNLPLPLEAATRVCAENNNFDFKIKK